VKQGKGSAPRPATTTVPVVVLTRSPSPLLHGVLGVVRSLGRWGVPVYAAVAGHNMPSDYSRYLQDRFTVTFDESSPARYLNDLLDVGRLIGRRSILLPIDEPSSMFLADNDTSLREWFEFPRQERNLVHALANKKDLYALCQRWGVPTPQTLFPEDLSAVRDFCRHGHFPVVVKAIDPRLLHEHAQGKSVTVARTADELLGVFERASVNQAPNLLLQEYIPGGSDSIWMFNGYFDESSDCLLSFTGVKLRQCLPDTGPTSLGLCRHNETIDRSTKEFLKSLRYRGIVDLGYRYDARDGRYKLLDVNPRIGSTFRLFVGPNGMDVARALYLDLTGQPVPESSTPEGRKWLVEQYDLLSSVMLGSAGRLGIRDWLRSLKGIDETAWFARDDLAPFPAMLRCCMRIAWDKAAGGLQSNGARRTAAESTTS
jgi:D-aspartate ligase